MILRIGYEARAQIIGFNLPFDISRIAIGWSPARGSLRGGYSFQLSPRNSDPNIRVKHLSSTTALVDFAKPGGQDTPRGMRKHGLRVAPHRGFFCDVHTLAAALLSGNFSLDRLCKLLGTRTQKHGGVDYDGPITEAFIDYARADVQTTWECFEKLRDLYASYRLSMPLHRIQSEASIGKACLKDMGIKPLLECQPGISREMFGLIMPTYFGGRAEAHIRREVRQVLLTDFKSMYPTVNTLMGLWEFMTADGYTTEATTELTQSFLDSVELADLQKPSTWLTLRTIVQLRPEKDILPVRTAYRRLAESGGAAQGTLTIGLNVVSSDSPLWFTLADMVGSKLQTGKAPVIDRAITFHPGPRQAGLKKLSLLGRPAFLVDAATGDAFKLLVDMRDSVGKDHPASHPIKIIVNSAAYGVSAEVNRDDAPKPEHLMIYGPEGAYLTADDAIEQPGKFFNPFLATTITGGARLMLTCAECIAADQGLDYVFCDTDSIAMAKPKGASDEDFYARAQRVVDWFQRLNPYEKPGSILKIEDVNFGAWGSTLQPLYAYAISAKRYALFNLDAEGYPIIRKFSAHGLGHLVDPYLDWSPAEGIPKPIGDVRKLGGKRWMYDFWYHILIAGLSGKPSGVRRDYHPALKKPAVMRYSASSPPLLRWMKHFNEGKPYAAQVKPFNFLIAPIAGDALCEAILGDEPCRGRPKTGRKPKPIAPYDRDPGIAASRAFDRETGEPVPITALKSYAEALRSYHVSPEDKFENGGPADVGRTERRHLRIIGMRLIGKEANRVGDHGLPDPGTEACVSYG